jgi:hypothetical protein
MDLELQEVPQTTESTTNTEKEVENPESPVKASETSPLKSCRKSPLKRMRTLENKDNIENQENIETTYIKTHATEDKPEENCSDEDESADSLEPRFLEAENRLATINTEAKGILGNQTEYQDTENITETQELSKVVDINSVLDVDSNVINYGQFICGKILGSTLLLSNISDVDQIVTMNLSKQKIYQCDEIFGQYNRDELPFSYNDGTTIHNSEIDHSCWFIENPVSKELQKTITLKIGPNQS